jgi:hypothetical protein
MSVLVKCTRVRMWSMSVSFKKNCVKSTTYIALICRTTPTDSSNSFIVRYNRLIETSLHSLKIVRQYVY